MKKCFTKPRRRLRQMNCINCTETRPEVLGSIDRPIGYKHYKGAICSPCLIYLLNQDDERIRAEAARDKLAAMDHPFIVGSDYP